MNHYYEDILSRIAEKPAWFDEHGVPRYGAFAPDKQANIYATEIALLAIDCQNCGHGFKVCMSWDRFQMRAGHPRASLVDRALDHSIHYGDPPNIGCCASGPTMNSEPKAVLEFWVANIGAPLRDQIAGQRWLRRADLERPIDTDEPWPAEQARVWVTRYAYENEPALGEAAVARLVRAAQEHQVDSRVGFYKTLHTVLGWTHNRIAAEAESEVERLFLGSSEKFHG